MKLVLLRHGESLWNQENRFTGWTDVDLSSTGIHEAQQSGLWMRDAGLTFDKAYTSVLKRAIRTLWLALEPLDLLWLPTVKDWRLNERHYGALQGLNKTQTATQYGSDQVKLWRRSFDVQPPALAPDDPRSPAFDRRYKELFPQQLPLTESLQDTLLRFMPLWEQHIVPDLKRDLHLLIAAHGNTLRSIVMLLEHLTPEQIVDVEIPTGKPLVYTLSDDISVLDKYYLGD